MRKLFGNSVAIAVFAAFARLASAQATDTLAHLVATNGSLTIGDKVFNNFGFVASGLTTFNASQIQVTASVNVNTGVYYLTWAGNMSLVSGGTATADLVLNYRVTATAGVIDMIDQMYTGSAQPTGGGFLSVDETVRDHATGQLVANSHLDGNDLSDPFAEIGDNLFIAPGRTVLDVTKDIGFGIVNGGFVTISEVSQSFHQTVPEPGTAALISLGLAPLALAVRRRRNAK